MKYIDTTVCPDHTKVPTKLIIMYFSLGKDLTSWLKTCSRAGVVSEMLMMTLS